VSTWQPASGRQLWALNTNELLPLALRRAPGLVLDKTTACALLAEFRGLKGAFPGECRWPASCASDGCWLLEQATYIGAPNGDGTNGDGAKPDPARFYDRKVQASDRKRVL
jgi:hypothetical protein